MADQYNSAHTGAEIDQAVSDVQNNKVAWGSKPQPSDTKPKAPGAASAGSESAYARGDHVHPHDSAKIDDPTTKSDGQALVYNVTTKKWEAKTLEAGGASVFLVTLTTPDYTSEYYDTDITADKSFAEIYAAYQNDDIIRAKWGSWILDLVSINNDTATFATCRGDADTETEINSVTAVCTGDIADYWVIGSYTNTIPGAANILPKAPGTAAAGTFVSYSRCDHVHPSDDTKLSLSGGTMTGIIDLNKNVLNLGTDDGGHQTYLSLENDNYAYIGGAYVAFRNNRGAQNGKPDAVAVQVRATIQVNSSPYFSDNYRWGPAVSVADLPTILGRYYPVDKADTNYTTLMARGESLNAAEVTPAVNGAIAWVYG